MGEKGYHFISRLCGIILLLLVTACQSGGPAVTATIPPLATGTPQIPSSLPTVMPSSTALPTMTPTAPISQELRVTTADLKGVEIRFWHPLAGESAAQMNRLVSQFNMINTWGVRVNIVTPGGDGPLAGAVDQAKPAELPEVILAASEDLAYWNESRSLLVDLNLYLNDPAVGLSNVEREGYLPVFWKQDSAGSQQLGLPALRTTTGLIYNRSFATELKFRAPPSTPPELLAQVCAAAKANNQYADRQGTGGWMVDTAAITALSWISAFGASVVPGSPKGDWKFDQAGSVDSFRYLRSMQEKGCLWVPKNPTPQVYFGNRNALVYSATLQDLALQNGYQSKVASKDDWSFIPFPSPDGKGVLYAYGYSYAVLKSNPKSQMAAWLFVRWMSQPIIQARMASTWISLPVSKAMLAEMASVSDTMPWPLILPLESAVRPAPSLASWRVVRRPLEDAFWQVFNVPTADLIPQILPVLDQMCVDLLKTPP